MKTVAIVIPCRNEEKYIDKCLDSILNQDYPQSLISIYVCDGLSTDKTLNIIERYLAKYSNIHLIKNEKQSTPFALNLGIKNSSSDYVMILGAHSELYSDYISNSITAFENNPTIACTGGLIDNIYENNISEVIGKAMSSAFGVGNAHFRTGNKDGFVDTVAFGTYKRNVFEKIGYFDEELIRNQDDEFNYRLTKAGLKIYLSKKIRCKYIVRGTFKKVFNQYYQYGYWKVYVGKKHQAITSIRQIIPLAFVLFLFSGLALSLIHHLFFMLYFIGIFFYSFTASYFAFKKSDNINQLGKIMFSFFILHFSYGSGYLKGIIDFFILQKRIKKEEQLTR